MSVTAAERRVLYVLVREEERNGLWPIPVRRLGELAGLASPSTVHRHLNQLQRAGLVERSPYPRGGFRPTLAGEEAVYRVFTSSDPRQTDTQRALGL